MSKSTTPARFEACEARRMMSASVAEAKLDHETLTVRGLAKSANVMTVTQDVAANTLTVTVVSTPVAKKAKQSHGDNAATPASTEPVTYTHTFDATGVTLVKVRGGKFADAISLVNADGTTPFSLDARVNGDAGNDTITTGSGNDRVAGGKGDDVVSTGAGNDEAWGEDGNDNLRCGSGKDHLWGGNGDDKLDGGKGDDSIVSLIGDDRVTGGDGKDTFVIKKPKHGHGVAKDFKKGDHESHSSNDDDDNAVPAPTA